MYQRDGDKKVTNPINLILNDFQQDRTMFLKAEWDASPSADVDHYIFQYKKTTDTNWLSTNVSETTATVPVETQVMYDVRVAAATASGNRSAFTGDQHTVSLINLTITRYGGTVGSDPAIVVQDWQFTGTVSISEPSRNLFGSGTKFLKEIRVGDKLKIGDNKYVVDSLINDTELRITTDAIITTVDSPFYLADTIIFNGDFIIQAGRDGIRFPESGWKITDDSIDSGFGIISESIGFTNNETDSAVGFLSVKNNYNKFSVRNGDKIFLVDVNEGFGTMSVEFDENRIREKDGYIDFNNRGFLTSGIFEPGESYYRYDQVVNRRYKYFDSFEQNFFRCNPRDKDITQKYTQTGITAVDKKFPLFDFQDFQLIGNDIRYELEEANCIDVTTSTTIAFTSLSGLTITDHYGSCTLPTVSGNNVVFSDTGSLTAFRFSNGQWIVTEQGSGTTARNVGDEGGVTTTGNGTISNGTWGTDNIYSYNWNYGCNASYVPAKLNNTSCADGTVITNPAVYGFNGADVILNEYETNLDVQQDQTGSRTLTNGTRYSAGIDPNGAGGYLEQYPRGINYWDSTTDTLHFPSHERNTKYNIEFLGSFNASSAGAYLLLELQINGGSNRVLRSKLEPIIRNGVTAQFVVNAEIYVGEELAQYGAKIYITPIGSNGTLSGEGIQISKAQ